MNLSKYQIITIGSFIIFCSMIPFIELGSPSPTVTFLRTLQIFILWLIITVLVVMNEKNKDKEVQKQNDRR